MAEELGQLGKQIQELAESALSAEIIAPSHEPSGYYYLQQAKGDAALVLAQPRWHAETLETPDEMGKFIAQRLAAKALKNPAIFYGKSSIMLAYDIDTRRDFANCPLTQSSQWQTLNKLNGQQRDQKSFIRDLRVSYRGCVADSNLINNLRGIKWQQNDGGNADIQHGKESMGRQIISQVQGVDIIPEEITLTIPVFENHPFRARVQCAVDVFVENRSFALTPFPQELQNAVESALDDILVGLTKEGFPPAFRGAV